MNLYQIHYIVETERSDHERTEYVAAPSISKVVNHGMFKDHVIKSVEQVDTIRVLA